jgi:hypothetical protein
MRHAEPASSGTACAGIGGAAFVSLCDCAMRIYPTDSKLTGGRAPMQ